MSQRRKSQPKALTEDQIDEIVTSQANDESAWEEPVEVHRPRGASLSIPAELAARAAFLAGLHRTPDVQEWVTKVLRERIELEEVAFAEAKRDREGAKLIGPSATCRRPPALAHVANRNRLTFHGLIESCQ